MHVALSNPSEFSKPPNHQSLVHTPVLFLFLFLFSFFVYDFFSSLQVQPMKTTSKHKFSKSNQIYIDHTIKGSRYNINKIPSNVRESNINIDVLIIVHVRTTSSPSSSSVSSISTTTNRKPLTLT